MYSNIVTTVSPTYAQEVRAAEVIIFVLFPDFCCTVLSILFIYLFFVFLLHFMHILHFMKWVLFFILWGGWSVYMIHSPECFAHVCMHTWKRLFKFMCIAFEVTKNICNIKGCKQFLGRFSLYWCLIVGFNGGCCSLCFYHGHVYFCKLRYEPCASVAQSYIS